MIDLLVGDIRSGHDDHSHLLFLSLPTIDVGRRSGFRHKKLGLRKIREPSDR
jgi:hypothetical protein